MLFLIDYSRDDGKLISLRAFADTERKNAYEARFALERMRDREGTNHEVVLLEAASEEIIRTTHSRYFSSDNDAVEPVGMKRTAKDT